MPRLPRPGETLSAHSLIQSPGGKGANQAVAVARMGARCALVGRVGDDSFGPTLREGLKQAGVDTGAVRVSSSCPSGIALIHVDDQGQNAITVVAGSNGQVSTGDIDHCAELISQADAVLLQLEIPLESVARALAAGRAAGKWTVLDPAPAPPGGLPADCLAVDVLSPNQSEAEALCGVKVVDVESAAVAAKRLQALGARQVVIKLGEQGAFWLDHEGQSGHVRAARIQPVDTTAAGDAFTAALTVSLAEGLDLETAVRRGCAAGTLAALEPGAQQAMPTRTAVLKFLEQMP